MFRPLRTGSRRGRPIALVRVMRVRARWMYLWAAGLPAMAIVVPGCVSDGGQGVMPTGSGRPDAAPPAMPEASIPLEVSITATPMSDDAAVSVVDAADVQVDDATTPAMDDGARPGWRMTWNDEFEGPMGAAPDDAKWGMDIGPND